MLRANRSWQGVFLSPHLHLNNSSGDGDLEIAPVNTSSFSLTGVLPHLFAHVGDSRPDVSVLLSNHYCRFLTIPWQNGSQLDVHGCFQSVYGPHAHDWQCLLHQPDYRQSGQAIATHQPSLQQLCGELASRQGHLRSMTPLIVALSHYVAQRYKLPQAMVVAVEPGLITVAMWQQGHIRSVSQWPYTTHWPAELERIRKRLALQNSAWAEWGAPYVLDLGTTPDQPLIDNAIRPIVWPEHIKWPELLLQQATPRSLDFVRANFTPSLLAKAALVLCVLVFIASVAMHQWLQQQEAESHDDRAHEVRPAQMGDKQIRALKREVTQANLAITSLNIPLTTIWTILLPPTPDVALLSIEMANMNHQHVRINGTAQSASAMFSYIDKLQSQRALAQVLLSSHEQSEQADWPLRFTLEVSWQL